MALQLLILALSVSTSFAQSQSSTHEGCIHLPIVHSTNQQAFGKRAVQFSLANRSDVAYYAKLELGTPPQPQFVQLDTGSFELWVNPTCATAGSFGDAGFCSSVGTFDTSKSSTFQNIGTTKSLRYGIGSANITYVKDDIALPGSSSILKGVQFGVATATEDEFSGILGIGYGLGLTTRYRNFVDELAAQNVTRVKAFTLALGGKDEQEGVIVFGGVDTSKFAGRLARLPIIPAAQSPDGVPRYWVAMQSMTLTPPSLRRKTYSNSTMQVFLDSGSTLTLLPTALVAAVAADFGATSQDSSGFYSVDCALTKVNGTLDFAFEGVTVRVPYKEIIRQSGNQCVLGIMPNPDFVLLGDTFLRSAYVIFDLDNHAVWMTQYTNCGSSPAAVNDSKAFSSLVGTCNLQKAAVNDAAASSSVSTGTPTTVSTGGAAGGAASPSRSSTVSAAGTVTPGRQASAFALAILVAVGVVS